MGDSVARTPFRSNGKKAPQLSKLEEQARKQTFAQKQRSTQEKEMKSARLKGEEMKDCRSTLRSMPSTHQGKTEPRLFFITTLRFARYGDRSSEPAETRSLLLEPLLVVWGTVAHLSLKRRCSQVKKLLTSAATTPDLQRPIFRKYIDFFIAHNRTLTLN